MDVAGYLIVRGNRCLSWSVGEYEDSGTPWTGRSDEPGWCPRNPFPAHEVTGGDRRGECMPRPQSRIVKCRLVSPTWGCRSDVEVGSHSDPQPPNPLNPTTWRLAANPAPRRQPVCGDGVHITGWWHCGVCDSAAMVPRGSALVGWWPRSRLWRRERSVRWPVCSRCACSWGAVVALVQRRILIRDGISERIAS